MNPHAFRQGILSPRRLPFPPSGLMRKPLGRIMLYVGLRFRLYSTKANPFKRLAASSSAAAASLASSAANGDEDASQSYPERAPDVPSDPQQRPPLPAEQRTDPLGVLQQQAHTQRDEVSEQPELQCQESVELGICHEQIPVHILSSPSPE